MHGTTPACPLSPGALFLLALMADKCDWELQIQAPGSSKFGGLGHYGSCWVQVIEKHCVIFIALCQASVSLFHWPCYRHDEELCTEYTDGKWVSWHNANVKFINEPYINLFSLDPLRNTLFFTEQNLLTMIFLRGTLSLFPPPQAAERKIRWCTCPRGWSRAGRGFPSPPPSLTTRTSRQVEKSEGNIHIWNVELAEVLSHVPDLTKLDEIAFNEMRRRLDLEAS